MLQKAAQVSTSIYHHVELEIPRYSDKRPSIRCIPETGRTAARSLTAVAPVIAAVILLQVRHVQSGKSGRLADREAAPSRGPSPRSSTAIGTRSSPAPRSPPSSCARRSPSVSTGRAAGATTCSSAVSSSATSLAVQRRGRVMTATIRQIGWPRPRRTGAAINAPNSMAATLCRSTPVGAGAFAMFSDTKVRSCGINRGVSAQSAIVFGTTAIAGLNPKAVGPPPRPAIQIRATNQ